MAHIVLGLEGIVVGIGRPDVLQRTADIRRSLMFASNWQTVVVKCQDGGGIRWISPKRICSARADRIDPFCCVHPRSPERGWIPICLQGPPLASLGIRNAGPTAPHHPITEL